MSLLNPSDTDNRFSDIVTMGALTAGLPALGYLSSKNDQYGVTNKLGEFGNKLIGSDYLTNQINRTIVSTTSAQVLSTSEQGLKKVLLSQLMALEEASPLHVLRTLQLSNFLQPFADLAKKDEAVHITPNNVRNQQHYYESLIKYINEDENRKIKRKLEVRDLTRGMFYKNNTLYGATKEGAINTNDVVVRNAKLVLGGVQNGEIFSQNHIADKFANNIGSSLNKQGLKEAPLLVVGAKNGLDFSKKWYHSTLRYSLDVGFKTFDNPLAGIEEMMHGVGANYTGVFESKIWQGIKSKANINFGTGGNYSLGIRDSLKITAKNVAVKGSALYLGYQGVDSLLRTLSPTDGLFDQGLGAGLTNMYASSRVAFAEAWSDRFQGYKERQEQSAPGSTNLTTLLAFPLAGALAGAQVAYFNRMGMSAIKGTEAAANIYNVEKESKALQSLGIDKKLKPMKRNALLGGLAGAALTLPFLPGALIGESSSELKALYSGEKEVPEKATKGWMFGGGAWEGSNTKFHTKNWVARVRADATDKVRYGDDANKKAMDPFLHPFSYLKDPYKFEKRNAESMPYPVWGMDVGYGGFFGKAFERTIGQIIKPDIINPAYKDALAMNIDGIGPNYAYEATDKGIGTIAGKVIGSKQSVGKAIVEESKSLLNLGKTSKLQGISSKDASLINDGLMVGPATASYNPNQEALGLSYRALMDFTGIKGWSSSLVVDGLGLEPGTNTIQLARSGEAVSAGRDLLEQNLGDLMGCFTPEMRVKSINGYVEIQDIKIGDLVLSKGGVYRSVKNIYIKDFTNILLLNVTTRSFKSTIRCTIDHVFPGLKQEYNKHIYDLSIIDRPIGDYILNDYLLIPETESVRNISEGPFFDEIIDIRKELYTGLMYDLEIDGSDVDNENDVNYYTIEGILCHNSGEFQRKILPTSSGSLPDRFNPITNNAASWLPSDKSKYYADFKHGNMYDQIDRGEERLPGVGLEALYPELKGIDPEDYPLVFKHKILSNVAKGSKEFINSRTQAITAYKEGKLSQSEIDILGTTLEQEVERTQRKDFYETPNKLRGPIGSLHNALWETMRTNAESPLEMLTPIRPAAKFLHKRTAIEDYMETQLGGPDTAIWTNPYSHFIKPALNKTRQSLDPSGTFIPQEAKDKYTIDEYFDKFKYLKARRNGIESQGDSTVISSSLLGLNTKDKVLKFRASLQDEQKDYFESFSKETDNKKRDKIRAIIPEDIRRGYEQIWQNVDIANKARKSGNNIQEAIAENINQQTNKLKDVYDVKLTKEDTKKARDKVFSNSDNYVDQGISERNRIKYTEDEILRRKMADKESLTYIANKTGVPNSKFIGWDPRLTVDDIKIRTLSIGGQDLKRFGFWAKDEERMNRLASITQNSDQVFHDIDSIKTDIKSDRRMKYNIERTMFNKGFKASKIDLVDSNYNSILVKED